MGALRGEVPRLGAESLDLHVARVGIGAKHLFDDAAGEPGAAREILHHRR